MPFLTAPTRPGPDPKPPRSVWLIPAGLVLLSLVPAIAGVGRLAQLLGGAAVTPANARFFAAPVPVMLHIPAAVVFSLLGAFQFAPFFRRRYPSGTAWPAACSSPRRSWSR